MMQRTIIFTLVGITMIVLAGAFLYSFNAPSAEASTKAIIIDQLYSDVPNTYFHKQAKKYFEDAGYQVDLYTTENATVSLFKKLPSMDYKYIVMRSHALEAESEDKSVMIFTGEKYSEEKYISEQLFGHLKKGTPLLDRTYSIDKKNSTGWIQVNETTRMITSPATTFVDVKDEYFLIPPKMVTDGMEGRFPDSIIILGGCSTAKNPSLAESFITKGASEVIGWDNLVSSSDNDRALLKLLEKMLVEEKNTKDSLDEIMKDWTSNPKYESRMYHFSR